MSEIATTNARRARGRPRLFDEEAVLDQLTALFWEQGYARTSVADLVSTSGVHKSSLYSTFGSKDELFVTILRRYFETRMARFTSLIETAGPGVDGIQNFLELVREETLTEAGHQGCLLVNSAIELHGNAPGFEGFAQEYRIAMRDALLGLVGQAQPDVALDDPVTQQRTDVLLTFLFGVLSSARGGADEAELGRVIDAMHATVDTWRV